MMKLNIKIFQTKIAKILTICILLLSQTLITKADYQQRIAVCIGIDSYTNYPKLNCAVNDATAISIVLKSFGFNKIILLTNENATKINIYNTFHKLNEIVNTNDILIVFYAGHGWINNKSISYILPVETRKNYEENDGIPISYLKNLTKSLLNNDTLFLLDSCYSGNGIINVTILDLNINLNLNIKNIQMLTAGGERDRAFESNGHGLFTHNILNYFATFKSNNGVNQISTLKLAKFVYGNVKKETSGWQIPQFGRVLNSNDIMI